MPALKVSSAEFLRSYGRVSEAALREPVSITSHGRERLVLLSVDEYNRLWQHYRVALHPSELSEEDIRALEEMEPSAEAEQFNHEIE